MGHWEQEMGPVETEWDTHTALPGAQWALLRQLCSVFLLSWAQFCHFPFTLSSPLSPPLSIVCSPVLCLLPKVPVPLVDLAAVSHLLCIQGGTGQLKVIRAVR